MAFAKQVFGCRYACTVGVHANNKQRYLIALEIPPIAFMKLQCKSTERQPPYALKAATSQDEQFVALPTILD